MDFAGLPYGGLDVKHTLSCLESEGILTDEDSLSGTFDVYHVSAVTDSCAVFILGYDVDICKINSVGGDGAVFRYQGELYRFPGVRTVCSAAFSPLI